MMPIFPATYHHRIYDSFKNMELNDHRRMVRFFEEHQQGICQLEDEQYFELLVCYLRALFETGAYYRYLKKVDSAIEFSLQFNYCEFEEKDVFQYLLFRKAASYFHLMEYGKAEKVLKELVKIDPVNSIYCRFLRKVMRSEQPAFIQNTKAFCVFLFLSAAFLISIEILFVRNFYPHLSESMEFTRNTIFSLGFMTLVLGDGFHRWKVFREVSLLAGKHKKKKRTTSISDESC